MSEHNSDKFLIFPVLLFGLFLLAGLYLSWVESVYAFLILSLGMLLYVTVDIFLKLKHEENPHGENTEQINQLGNDGHKIAELEATITSLNNSTKMLVQRDLELNRANEKLKEVDKLKSEFVSLVTHQLRTPLSGMRWALSMFINGEMGELTSEQKTYLMKAYESNNRMITLINDMLHADKVESGTAQFKFIPTNFIYLLENTVNELRPIAESRGIKLELNTPSHFPEMIIDPTHVRIVLQNLIDNAIKYSEDGGVVKVIVSQEDTVMHLTVSDTGIGIPEEQQEKVFKRFFRAKNAVHVETDGSGLGLYIVKNVIRKHHGTITFTSTMGEGTTFDVTLPLNYKP